MVVIGNSLNSYFNVSLYNEKEPNKIVNVSLDFSFFNYCLDPIELVDKLVISKAKTISIFSIHDIIPTIIKSKKYYRILKRLKLIKCSRRTDIKNQILEVNYVIYNKYILFQLKYIARGNGILNLYSDKKLIGVHVRLSDTCLESCNLSTNNLLLIANISKRICGQESIIMLSSFSKEYNTRFQLLYKNVFIYNPSLIIKHSSKSRQFNKEDIEKTIMDIYLTSKSDFLILSGGSTFSLLILYTGYYKNYEKCLAKKYLFFNNLELFDHLEKFRKFEKCKNVNI